MYDQMTWTQIFIGVCTTLILTAIYWLAKLIRNYFKLIMNKLTLLEMRQNAAHKAWCTINGNYKELGQSYQRNYTSAMDEEVEEHKIKIEGIE